MLYSKSVFVLLLVDSLCVISLLAKELCAFGIMVQQLLQDVHQRLVFRAQVKYTIFHDEVNRLCQNIQQYIASS